jgi:hypothetical protein
VVPSVAQEVNAFVRSGEESADDGARDAPSGQGLEQLLQTSRGNGDQQPAGSLCVEAQMQEDLIHAELHAELLSNILAVAFDCAGDDPGLEGSHAMGESGKGSSPDLSAELSPLDLAQEVPEQAESSDISAGGGASFDHRLGCGAIQCGHGLVGGAEVSGCDPMNLVCEGEHAGSEGFGEDEQVAGLGAFERGGYGRIDETGDGKAEFGFFVLDAVTPDERHARLGERFHRPRKHLEGQLDGERV